MSGLHRLVLPALMAALVSSAARADIVIDNFTAGAQSVSNTAPSSTVSQGIAASSAVGGDRVITINNGTNVFNSTASVTPALGRFDFASQTSPPANTSTFLVTYDGSTSSTLNPTGLGGINTTGLGGIRLIGSNSSSGTENVVLTYYTNATSYSSYTLAIPSGASAQSFFVPFSSFTLGSGATTVANFTSLGAFTFGVSYANSQGSAGAFTTIALAVPEPSPLALTSLFGGLVGAGRMFLRRKSA